MLPCISRQEMMYFQLRQISSALRMVFVIVWIIGTILNAFRMARPLPRWFNNFTNVAHLFPRRLDDWSYFAVEARFTGNLGRWEPLRLADYSGMHNYGYLTRLDRVLDEAGNPARGPVARRELAAYIAKAHGRLFPDSPAVREVRFLRVSIPIGHPSCATPDGPWVTPAVPAVPAEWVRLIQVVRDVEWGAIRNSQIQNATDKFHALR